MDIWQDPKYIKGKYTVVEVDEDNVRMSKFIETELKCKFEDRKAFYEAEKEEDLLYYKKILRPRKEEVNFISGQLCISMNQMFFFFEVPVVRSTTHIIERGTSLILS